MNILNVEGIGLNPVLQKNVFKKNSKAYDSAVLAMEPYFTDTKNIDTLLVRSARRENLLWRQKYGDLVCDLDKDIYNRCMEKVKPLLKKYEKDLELSPKEGVGTIIMGLPGSGKTTALEYLASLGLVEKDYIETAFKPNADEIKRKLPNYDVSKGTSEIVHNESVKFLEKIVKDGMKQKVNVIIEMSGGYFDYIKRTIKRMQVNGYRKINIVYIDIQPETSMKRIAARFEKTGRFLDPKVVYDLARVRDKKSATRDYTMHPADNFTYLRTLGKYGKLDFSSAKSTKLNFFWVDNNGKKPCVVNAN